MVYSLSSYYLLYNLCIFQEAGREAPNKFLLSWVSLLSLSFCLFLPVHWCWDLVVGRASQFSRVFAYHKDEFNDLSVGLYIW